MSLNFIPGLSPPTLWCVLIVCDGAPVTEATDWWGWAATLAFAASGAPPFGRGPMDVVLNRVSRGEADLSGVDPRLAPLLYAALSPDPRQRPDADEVVVDWPHRYLGAELEGGRIDRRTELAVLTHDPKFDVPLLEEALKTDAAYIGAMGSRRTHEDRLARLRDEGVSEEALSRLASPIGLDIGARTPEETAVSICAEIIAHRRAVAVPNLRDGQGPKARVV